MTVLTCISSNCWLGLMVDRNKYILFVPRTAPDSSITWILAQYNLTSLIYFSGHFYLNLIIVYIRWLTIFDWVIYWIFIDTTFRLSTLWSSSDVNCFWLSSRLSVYYCVIFFLWCQFLFLLAELMFIVSLPNPEIEFSNAPISNNPCCVGHQSYSRRDQ